MSSGEREVVAFYGVRGEYESQRLATWSVKEDVETIEFGELGTAVHKDGELIVEVEGEDPRLHGETSLGADFTRKFVESEDRSGMKVTETPIFTDGELRGMLVIVTLFPLLKVSLWQLVIDGIGDEVARAYIPSK